MSNWLLVRTRAEEVGNQTLLAMVHARDGKWRWQIVRYGPTRHLVFLDDGEMAGIEGALEAADHAFDSWAAHFKGVGA